MIIILNCNKIGLIFKISTTNKLLLFQIFLIIPHICWSQHLTLHGEISSSTTDNINKYGELGSSDGLTFNGSTITVTTVPGSGSYFDPLFHYDGSDINSYPGTGNTWYDLSGNEYHAHASTNTSYVEYSGTNDSWEFKGLVTDGHGLFIQDLNYITGNSDQIANMSISSMIKLNSGTIHPSDDQRIILSFDRSAVFRFSIGGDTSGAQPGKPVLMFANGSTGNISDITFSNSPDLRDDLWHLVTVTFEAEVSNGLKLYIDGQLVQTISTSFGKISEHTTSETPRYGVIGSGSENNSASVGATTSPPDMFYGFIGSLIYYDKTLTASEVATLFSNFDNSSYTN